MSKLNDLLARVKSAREAATPGEWKVSVDGDGFYEVIRTRIHDGKTGYGDDTICEMDSDKLEVHPNGKFIALAANEILKLVAICEVQAEALTTIFNEQGDADAELALAECEKIASAEISGTENSGDDEGYAQQAGNPRGCS